MSSKRRKTQQTQPALVNNDEIDYEVEADHLTEINGEDYVCVTSKWYSKTADYNMEDEELNLPIKPRDPEVKTIEESATATVERKKQNKGKKIFACPYCLIEFKPGRSDHCLRHMNGDKRKNVTCAKRKLIEKDVSQPSALKPVHVRTD